MRKDDNNKFVNNKDFGKIAQSSRGSNTPTQIGDQNQRETYNAKRGKAEDKLGWTGKVSKGDISAPKDPKHPITKNNAAVRKSQRAGGSGK
jgi:hypothetical protein